ncbi:winged helix-turn-helix transcriptional regulator [Rhizobium sp. LjRoot258]|uniref:winged helix-turn-helix transcriptional regulator n=1 Tax=Rhizobium sp. LjRoot258 TaxID=3342299 RepID=UPI003F4FF473
MLGLPKLDRIDINILGQLQQNSRLSNVDLAQAVGLSPRPCLARVKRLEKAGYITSYNARLNLGKLVDHITVFTEVTLNDHTVVVFDGGGLAERQAAYDKRVAGLFPAAGLTHERFRFR